MTPQDMIESLTNRRKFLQGELENERLILERVKQRIAAMESELEMNQNEIDEFGRECLNSPKIDILPIEYRVRTALKKSGVTTVYGLRFVLRHDRWINGLGDVSRTRLTQILAEYDSKQAQTA